MSLPELVPILQMAVGPVILISGIGLLLLSMTNRFARVIDRSRQLSGLLRTADAAGREVLRSEIHILTTRAMLVRRAITLAALSLLFAAGLIITLFLAAITRWGAAVPVVLLFIACMASLIWSLVTFLQDINLSLAALKLELTANPEHPPE